MATPLEPSSNANNGQQGGGALRSPNVTRAGSGGLTGEAAQSLYFLSPSREQGLRAPRADVLLPGHFSGELAKRYTAMGFTALSCDYCECESSKRTPEINNEESAEVRKEGMFSLLLT